ncbi:serine hydrolase domain-containing protein [Ekhidna sp.]
MALRFLFIFFILSSCYLSDEVVPDQDVWKYALPSDVGISNDSLLVIDSRAKIGGFEVINGLIIIRNDKLIFENYYQNNNRQTTQNLGRASMVFTLAAIGIAEDKRLLSIEDPIADYLPEYENIFQDNIGKQEITIAHLLAHRGGFSWNESIEPRFSDNNNLNQMKASEDWARFVLDQPLEAPAGLRFNLNTGTGVILGKIIENASGQDFVSFLTENILDPLLIDSLTISTDPNGNYNGGDGIELSLIDWTKFGYLILNEGIWRGRKIIDPNFLLNTTSTQTTVSGTFELGYVWWLFGDDFANAFGIDHEDIFYIPGELGQHMYIIPSEKMIVSIFADNFFFGFVNPSLNLFAEITYTLQ